MLQLILFCFLEFIHFWHNYSYLGNLCISYTFSTQSICEGIEKDFISFSCNHSFVGISTESLHQPRCYKTEESISHQWKVWYKFYGFSFRFGHSFGSSFSFAFWISIWHSRCLDLQKGSTGKKTTENKKMKGCTGCPHFNQKGIEALKYHVSELVFFK